MLLGMADCASFSKPRHVLISVVDETTRQPLAGIRVSTQDQEDRPFPDKPTSTDVITGPDGLALLTVKDTFGSYYIHTKNPDGKYCCESMVGLSPNGEAVLRKRLPDDRPTTPDTVVTVLSDQERARRRKIAEQKLENMERQARHILEENPNFWPETQPESLWVKDDVGRMLIGLRWKSASKAALGSQADIDAIRRVVLERMKIKNAKVNEIRWLTPNRVMVYASWYGGPLAAAGYTFVLDKSDGQWTVIVRYMDWIS